MTLQPNASVTNNFIAGLKTEFTGLNFPENAATSVDNCVFTLIGDVLRREGIDYEANFIQNIISRANADGSGAAVSSYKWNNVAGDGSTQIVVLQVGKFLYFFTSSFATVGSPLSTKLASNTIDLSSFVVPALDPGQVECQFADGNGYLFVFHPQCDPIYVTYSAGSLGATRIIVNIRDFDGVKADPAGLYSTTRPATLTNEHQYNLQNQGWNQLSYINSFAAAVGGYPSNSDVWWRFKDSTGAFNPTSTVVNTTLSGPAPKGSYLMNAFQQIRNQTGTALPNVTVNTRPKTGTWFQGRVWYVGADAASIGAHTFSETLYFSQIVTTSDQFGFCYQVNDPTSETLFDLLPTDGGLIKIQGCGVIYKLFPIQNGLLVFAANGIWFITGSQGIGFAATDYTITKISSVQNISSTSFIDVQGYPVFWNEEGIYVVSPSKQGGGLEVDNLTLGTILSFYSNIPVQSKKFARGDYHQIDYEIQWCYRSTDESSTLDRYQYDKILVYNTVNKAFYIYTLPQGVPWINGIRYVAGPGGSTSPDPTFKYITSTLINGVYKFTFSEERDSSFVDWKSFNNAGKNFVSTFTSGYRVHGKGIGQWQPVYLYIYSRNDTPNGYKLQSIWDYAGSPNAGKFSNVQLVTNFNPNFAMLTRRHKLRGHGLAFQLKVSSVDNLPFDIMGWTAYELISPNP